MYKRWKYVPPDEKEQKALREKLHISPVLAGVLAKKGMDVQSSEVFLCAQQVPYCDSFLMKDMEKACRRIIKAIDEHQHICIYGDYDVDGVSATSLLLHVLRSVGAKVDFYLPDRHSEGYGLHIESLEKLIGSYSLIITVDCGITAIDEANFVKDKADMIITDHHLPLAVRPDAFAVVNPNQAGCGYPNKTLCGAGVAFKLCQALFTLMGKNTEELEQYLDIVALATVADIVPLIGENRRIVKKGLAHINNIGLAELLKVCGCDLNAVNTGHIGFGAAPRLNAAGRLTHASAAVELLLADDEHMAHEKSLYLDAENKERQLIVENIFREASAKIEEQGISSERVIVVAGDNWHEGVIGIAASRLQEVYYRPIVIIAVQDGRGRASCRSIDGFNIKEALDFCADDFVIYGGHSKAAGFTIEADKIDAFTEHIKTYAKDHLHDEDLNPVLSVEAVVEPSSITENFINDISALEPFGMGNPKPQFVCQSVYVCQARKIGKEKNHLRFTFEKKGQRYSAVGWNMAQWAEKIEYQTIDILFQPELNVWNGRTSIQFKINDIHFTAQRTEKLDYSERFPSYDSIGQFYLSVKKQCASGGTPSLSDIMKMAAALYGLEFTNTAAEQCLKILSEINLVQYTSDKTVHLLPVPSSRIDIKSSPSFAARYREHWL